MVLMTAVLELLVVLYAFHFLSKGSKRTVSRVLAITAPLLIVSGIAYFYLLSTYTYSVPRSDLRLVKGTTCTANALAVYADRCPNLGEPELRRVEWEAAELWTADSIAQMRVMIVIAWAAMYIAIASAISAFLCVHMRYPTKRKSGTDKTAVEAVAGGR